MVCPSTRKIGIQIYGHLWRFMDIRKSLAMSSAEKKVRENKIYKIFFAHQIHFGQVRDFMYQNSAPSMSY